MKKSRTAEAGEVELQKLRAEIDTLDRQMIEILAKRGRIATRIGRLKQKSGLAVLQKKRWTEMMGERQKMARRHRLDSTFTEALFRLVQKHSIRLQRELLSATRKKK